MDVSVVMINYNTYELTKNAIESIFTYTNGVAFEIVLVDNMSPDRSGERLQTTFGEKIVFVQAGGNVGTAKAFNLGLKKSTGKYVLWLNTDVLVQENFIGKLYEFMQETPQCGVCGGNVFSFEGKPAHAYRKKLPSLKTLRSDMSIFAKAVKKLTWRLTSEEFNYTGKPMRVGYITGAQMMVRRSLFDEVGGFDEDIFMYYEEAEFTYRAVQRTGCAVISVPSARILHLEGASFKTEARPFSEKRYAFMLTGQCVYFYKCYGKDAAVESLNIVKRTYRRAKFLCRLLGKKEKAEEYAFKIRTVDEFLQEPERYIQKREEREN